ncbi:MAG: 3-phosphoshikimate 1-carboxyvinyltransferase, partial [Planctomycetota bacterium]
LPLPSPPKRAFSVDVRPPGSKSLTNRALLLAALAGGESKLCYALTDADDAKRMLAAVQQLGAAATIADEGTVTVRGVGGRWSPAEQDPTLFLNNAGTATRFLAAASVLAPGSIIIDGNARMRQRPIGELAEALHQLGVTVDHLGEPGCPPIRLLPPLGGPPMSPTLELTEQTRSSQFISALLLCGPFLRGGLTLKLGPSITSRAYVEMTLGLLDNLGATVRVSDSLRVVRVGPSESAVQQGAVGLDAFTYDVEPDASGATYFWAAAALQPGASCRIRGITRDSLQGDAEFPDALARMGVSITDCDNGEIETTGPRTLTGVMADMSDMPDAAMTLAVVAAFASQTSVIRGLRTLRDKETDRIAALQNELGRIGVDVVAEAAGDAGTITITPPTAGVDCSPDAEPVHFETYDDHRMAMAMSLVALRRPNVFIKDPACVGKTYPTYWTEFARLFAASQ